MRRVADGAAFTHRFMLVNEWTALRSVTLQAGVVLAQKSLPPAMDVLCHARPPSSHRAPLVRLMAIRAGHLSFQDRVTMRELKLRPHVKMTLKTGLRRSFRINDQVSRAAALGVQTPGAVTRFTADVHRVCSRRFQPGVRRGAKITHQFLVAIGAFIRPDEFRAGNTRWGDDGAIALQGAAGEERDREDIRAAD
jgi:hypothetical protein